MFQMFKNILHILESSKEYFIFL